MSDREKRPSDDAIICPCGRTHEPFGPTDREKWLEDAVTETIRELRETPYHEEAVALLASEVADRLEARAALQPRRSDDG